MTQDPVNLPAIASSLAGIPAALVPASIKALDRLIGAATDVPAAWLAQQKAKIDAQTQAYGLVEAEISRAAALDASADPEIVGRAVNVLVRKAYRKQGNRDAVAAAAIEELKGDPENVQSGGDGKESSCSDVDDDWLNVFERYAEDATSDRMQKLWGRVLSGEIRSPGRFSVRTLRFLSEFSQKDAVSFEKISEHVFGGMAPKSLVKIDKDLTELIALEASGLISGATGLGLKKTYTVGPDGVAGIREDNLAIIFKGKPSTVIEVQAIVLTPLGVELVRLLPGRDPRKAARSVAFAMRSISIDQAFLSSLGNDGYLIGAAEPLWLFPSSAPDEASP